MFYVLIRNNVALSALIQLLSTWCRERLLASNEMVQKHLPNCVALKTLSKWRWELRRGKKGASDVLNVEIDSNTATVVIFRLWLGWSNYPQKWASHYQHCEYLRSPVAKFRHQQTQPRGCFMSRSCGIDWNVSAKVCKAFISCQIIRDPVDVLILQVPKVS